MGRERVACSQQEVVKCVDLWMTDFSKSMFQGCFSWSRVMVEVSKMIRYRCSLNIKRCRYRLSKICFDELVLSN